ncbi:hypothetical protein [Streptomyces mirabilis]|uniref:hypothetical protein n=1 Tax=Streptomyces mirabilis TaxID=68239 RepID=UPI00369F55B8
MRLGSVVLGFVAAARSADIPAVVGRRAEAPLPLLCALLRRGRYEPRRPARRNSLACLLH